MSALFGSIRAITRIELRELRRHRWRSLLLLTLITIPVAAIVGGTTLVRITSPTDEERRSIEMGAATLLVERPFEQEERQQLRDILPEKAEVERFARGRERIAVPSRQLRAASVLIEGEATLAAGTFLLQRGRLPENAGEVALSPILLEGLGRDLGGSVTLEYGGHRTITGIVVDPEALSTPLVVRQRAAIEHGVKDSFLIRLDGDDVTLATNVADRLEMSEFDVTERSEISGEGGSLAWGLFVLGSIGFLEAGLVIAATFIVGLRRRQYEIGLLGSTGAQQRHITLSMLLSTGTLATLGALLGAVGGTAAAAALVPFLDRWNGRLNGGFEFSIDTLIAAAVMGVTVALLATLLPAWSAARMPIRIAMGGKRPQQSSSIVALIVGLMMIGAGLLLVTFASTESAVAGALAAIFGSILGVLGFGVCSPFFLNFLGGRAAALPLRWRLAVRDAGRFRTRNGPVVTAVLAGMSMSVTVAVMVASLDSAMAALPSPLRTDQLLFSGSEGERAARNFADEHGALAVSRLEAAYIEGEPVRAVSSGEILPNPVRQWIAVGDAELLRAIGVDGGEGALAAGRLLQLRASGGTLFEQLGIVDAAQQAKADTLTLSTWRDEGALPAIPVETTVVDQNVMSPAFVIDRSWLEQLGWESGPPIDRSVAPWLVRLDAPISATQLDQARRMAEGAVGVNVDAQQIHQRPARSFYHVVQWICIATGLIIVLVATALSTVESAADARILHSVGASPSLIRGHTAARAGYLAFLGCLLALPAGLIPARVLFTASNLPLEFIVPWFDLAVALLALPLLAYGVTWMAQRRSAMRPLAASALLLIALAAPTASAETIEWEPYVGEALDGSPLQGELGRINLPIDHANPLKGTMQIAFVRYRTNHPDPSPPIFFLAGGPGGSGVEFAAATATHPQMRFLEQADFIGIDQRGTGLSRPDLTREPAHLVQLPTDRVVGRDEVVAAYRSAAAELVRHASARGIDAASYNTQQSADDLEAIRIALGLEQVTLYGASYGTHLGLSYLRRHPEGVARALLVKVEGPDDTHKLPATVQRHLEMLAKRCRNDVTMRERMPDLLGTIRQLLARLETGEVRLDRESGGSIVLSPYDLQRFISNNLSFATTRAEIPQRLLEFLDNDWSGLLSTAEENRSIELSLMPWATDCASGASAQRQQQIDEQRRDGDNLLGDAILAPHYPQSCTPCRGCDLGDDFRRPFDSDVPTLFVSGDEDVRTPPSNVERLIDHFPNATQVIAKRAGHQSRELMSPEYRAIFQSFLRGEPVTDTTITLPPAPFTPAEDKNP